MILESINGPGDLRRLDDEELVALAAEIREFIVQAVAVTGGHLGSNLGVVELTLALHRVFDSPRDYLLWDTGHQAYVHKLVTGRREGFTRLRQAGGLSGYPSRAESEHDWVENSHASTILSYAHGLATAVELRGEDRRVVAVIGDGSMTGGMAFEALNNLGHSGRRVLIVVNDNGRSYAPTISRWVDALTRVRLHPSWTERRHQLEHLVGELPLVGRPLYRGVQGVKAAFREVLEPKAFFESFGVRYAGPIDGHDVPNMERALRDAAEYDGPLALHVLTDKGRGYRPAEQDEEKRLHDAPVFDPRHGPRKPVGAPVSYTDAFSAAVLAAAERDPRVVAITAAMPGPTGLLPFQDRFPDRFLDVGIAEQHAVTAAAGMAMGGLRPVVAVYSTFFTRAFDQANLDVGLHRLPVVFCLDRAGVTGDDGPSHHGVLDLALWMKIPGAVVFAPSSAQELEVMVADAMAIEGAPTVVRYPKGAARQVPADQVGSGLRARRLRAGAGDVCILAVGKLVEAALEAAVELDVQGITPTVWDVRVAKPLDPDMLADAAGHGLVVTAEDGVRVGGVGSAVVDALAALAALDGARLGPTTLVLGTPVEYLPHGKPNQILADLGLDGPGIAASVRAALDAAAVALHPVEG